MPARDSAASQQSQGPLSDLLNAKVDSPRVPLSSEHHTRDNNHFGDKFEKLLETAGTSSTNGQQRHQHVPQNNASRIEHSQASRKVRRSKRHFIADSEGDSEDDPGDGQMDTTTDEPNDKLNQPLDAGASAQDDSNVDRKASVSFPNGVDVHHLTIYLNARMLGGSRSITLHRPLISPFSIPNPASLLAEKALYMEYRKCPATWHGLRATCNAFNPA